LHIGVLGIGCAKLGNAVKFTPSGGTIELAVQTQADRIEISIADTGMGMTPECIEKLFHIEYKTHCAGTAGEEGTGLRLVIC
jgi:signal transduction histidine kinase